MLHSMKATKRTIWRRVHVLQLCQVTLTQSGKLIQGGLHLRRILLVARSVCCRRQSQKCEEKSSLQAITGRTSKHNLLQDAGPRCSQHVLNAQPWASLSTLTQPVQSEGCSTQAKNLARHVVLTAESIPRARECECHKTQSRARKLIQQVGRTAFGIPS